jgi:hypothetical protein
MFQFWLDLVVEDIDESTHSAVRDRFRGLSKFRKRVGLESQCNISWVIPRPLDQVMTPMVTDLSDYFLQLTSINYKKMSHMLIL